MADPSDFDKLIRLVDTPPLAVASAGCVLMAWWRGAPDLDSIRVLRGALTQFSQTQPRIAGLNFVAASRATKFAEPVRQEVAAIREENAARQIAIATVIEGTGFWASSVRSVASGLALLQREPFPSKNFDNAEDAVAWLAALLHLAPDAVTRLRAAAIAFREGSIVA